MEVLGLNILPKDPHVQIIIVGVTLGLLISIIFATTSLFSKRADGEKLGTLSSFLQFFYASFLKPHDGDGNGNGQQDALESFYKAQAGVYDVTRKTLLRGREDMLGLVAAQLVQKAARERTHDPKRIWVDVSYSSLQKISKELTWRKDRRRYGMEYRSNVRICQRGGVLLRRIPCRLFPISLRSSSKTICTPRMEECEGCLPGRENFPLRGS
jgi:hypothetical protein